MEELAGNTTLIFTCHGTEEDNKGKSAFFFSDNSYYFEFANNSCYFGRYRHDHPSSKTVLHFILKNIS